MQSLAANDVWCKIFYRVYSTAKTVLTHDSMQKLLSLSDCIQDRPFKSHPLCFNVVANVLLLSFVYFSVVNIYDEVVVLLSFEHFVLNNKHV